MRRVDTDAKLSRLSKCGMKLLVNSQTSTAKSATDRSLSVPVYIHMVTWSIVGLQWRHNDHDGVSNHHPHDCLLNRLFRRRSKKTSKLCAGDFPAQRASNVENVSIWWRHHGKITPGVCDEQSRGMWKLIQIFLLLLVSLFGTFFLLREAKCRYRTLGQHSGYQIMTCCLTVWSHYLNQRWLMISKVPCRSFENIIIRRSAETNQ